MLTTRKNSSHLSFQNLNEIFLKLAEKSHDVFWVRSPDYKEQLYISPIFEQVWGRKCSEVYHYPERWDEWLYFEDKKHLEESIAKRNPNTHPDDMFFENYRIVRPNGEIRWIHDCSFPIFNSENKLICFAGVAQDLTEQKLNEERLIENNQKLEQARANKAKSEFIRNVSHDILTPLGGIQQIFEALSNSKIPEPEIPEYACSGLDASKKLMELFDQIIDVSKKEHFDFEDNIVKFDLYKLLQDLTQTYDIVAKHKGLILEIQQAENVPRYLKGKHVRLHRILMNLLGNALKFTNQGSVKLLVELAQETGENTLFRFSVTDTGIGIPEEKHNAIFEPFSRLNPSFENQYKGSGLGLHLVKDYIEKMQGAIYVESQAGQGSTFICVIPLKRSLLNNADDVAETDYIEKLMPEMTPEKAPLENSVSSTTKTSDIKSMGRVLLVEDDRIAQKMGISYLKDKGYQADLAKSGEEALELTAKNSYDIICMDIGLGVGIDGVETTRRIRGDAQNKSQKAFITAVTAHGTNDVEIVEQCRSAGMQHIIAKPLSPEKIAEIQVLAKKESITPANNTVIDFDLWLSRAGGTPQLLEELVHMLGQDFNQNRHDLQQAYDARDLQTLQAITHKLKGALSYSGFPQLEVVIKAIELAAKRGHLEEVEKLYPETIAALDDAQVAYLEWDKTHPKA